MKTGHLVLALAVVLAGSALFVATRSTRRLTALGAVGLLLVSGVFVWIAARSEAFDAERIERYSEPVQLCMATSSNWFLAAGGNGDADGIYRDAEPETRVLIDLAEKHFSVADEAAVLARTGRYPDAVWEGYEAARSRLLLFGCVAHYGSQRDKVLRVQEGLCASDVGVTYEC